MEKIRHFFKRYGKLAMGTHIVASGISLAFFYTAFSAGIDIKKYIPESLKKKEESNEKSENSSENGNGIKKGHKEKMGTLAAAFVVHKAFTPVRIPFEIAFVTYIAKRFKL